MSFIPQIANHLHRITIYFKRLNPIDFIFTYNVNIVNDNIVRCEHGNDNKQTKQTCRTTA